MSSIVIAGDTSGSVTLQAPAVAGSTVLNLPATSGTIQTSGAGYTTNGVAYASSTSALTTGSALTFNGTIFSAPSIQVTDGTNGIDITPRTGGVQFETRGTNQYIDIRSYGTTSASYITLATQNTERMRITSAGDVGIGTSSPSQKLDATVSTATEGSGLAVTNSYAGGYGSGVTFYSVRSDTSAKLAAGSIVMNGVAAWNSNASTSSSMIFSTIGANTLAERARIDSSGNLLVGSTSSAQSSSNGVKVRNYGAVFVVNDGSTGGGDGFSYYQTSANAYRFYVNSNGQISATNTSISAISDIRFKENVRDLDAGLAEVMALKPRLYDWKEGKGANIKNARGFIAQEFEEVFPDLIDEWKDPAPDGEEPYKSVRQDLIPVLVKSIQEQQALITALTDRISVLENK